MSAEINQVKPKVFEVEVPSFVTGYFAFYKVSSVGQWQAVNKLSFESGVDPILPFSAFRTRDDAIKAAQAAWGEKSSIKLVAVDFEIAQ